MPNTHGAVAIGAPATADPPSTRAKFEALTQEEREALAGMAEANGEQPTAEPVEAMFLVVIPRSGTAVALQDVALAEKYSGRAATVEEMRVACDLVKRDIDQSRQAQITVTTQMQMAAAVQRQAQDAEMRQKLGL